MTVAGTPALLTTPLCVLIMTVAGILQKGTSQLPSADVLRAVTHSVASQSTQANANTPSLIRTVVKVSGR